MTKFRSLKELYFSINNKYYPDSDSFTIDSFNEKSCIKIIESFFTVGGKKFLLGDTLSNESGFRACHSSSAYLMSLILVEKNIKIIEKYIKIKDVHYILFITFLYHDYYFDTNNLNCEKEKLKSIIENLKSSKYLTGHFCYNNIKNYFKSSEYKNHGIIAGALLFDKLNANLKLILNNNCHSIIINNLLWSQEHKDIYDCISSIIIKHAIWFNNPEYKRQNPEKEEINDEKLEYVEINNAQRINFLNDPILFLLYIIDTIEPIKLFNKTISEHPYLQTNNYMDLLNNIFIRITFSFIEIKYSTAYESLFTKTLEEANNMKSWMNIEVDQKQYKKNRSYKTIIIKYNNK